MEKSYLEKNVLDLSYKRNLQLLNIFLISGIGVIFASIVALILNPEKLFAYVFSIIIIGVITYIIYAYIDERLKIISEKIKNIVKS